MITGAIAMKTSSIAVGLLVAACAIGLYVTVQSSDSVSDSVSVSGPGPGPAAGTAVEPKSKPAALDSASGSLLIADRIALVAQLAERRDLAALPWLLQTSLDQQPELAPMVIMTSAKLAALAPDPERDGAARRLGAWLQAESAREGRDARGNVAVLVEALGTVDSPDSVDALIAALEQQRLPLHVETLAVQGLFKLGDPRAFTPVQRWSERVAALPAADGLQEALRQEAELAARATLASLGS
jgi:hypothetical protein